MQGSSLIRSTHVVGQVELWKFGNSKDCSIINILKAKNLY